ncbi:hypothetical protein C8Q72DRAFT_774919 [Fomitopsis betulina]|nr:hypothetical protein C8Q72DRAFT_774919 [Fomitopsis betulina]
MPTPSQGSSRKKSSVPDIDWKANNGALLWQLIGELEKPENFRVLFGKRDKNEVFVCIDGGCAVCMD